MRRLAALVCSLVICFSGSVWSVAHVHADAGRDGYAHGIHFDHAHPGHSHGSPVADERSRGAADEFDRHDDAAPIRASSECVRGSKLDPLSAAASGRSAAVSLCCESISRFDSDVPPNGSARKAPPGLRGPPA